jgi:hypothetical protein
MKATSNSQRNLTNYFQLIENKWITRTSYDAKSHHLRSLCYDMATCTNHGPQSKIIITYQHVIKPQMRRQESSDIICFNCQVLYAQIMAQTMHKVENCTIIYPFLHLQVFHPPKEITKLQIFQALRQKATTCPIRM